MGNLTVKESGEMVNFISPNVSNITSFKVHFSPKQEGSGDPSPENVREITGWNGVEGYINNVAQSYSLPSNTLTISIDWTEDVGIVYGGYVDLISGELVEEWHSFLINSNTEVGIFPWGGIKTDSATGIEYATALFRRYGQDPKAYNIKENICDKLPYSTNQSKINTAYMYDGDTYGGAISLPTSEIGTTAESLSQYLADKSFTIVYKLRTPITHQLTPQQLSTLKGQNNFWSNADYIEIEYELTETFDIQKAKRKIILNQPHVESASGDLVTFDTDMRGKLKECKVYFSPVQEGEGDPSPDNVRNIAGWNGVSVGLPSEYQEVEYVEKNIANQYIDTGILGNGELQVDCKINISRINNGAPFFGSYGNSQRCYFLIQNNGGKTGYSYIQTIYSSLILEENTDYHINTIFNSNGQSLYINNELISSTNTAQSLKTDKNIYLFGYNFDGTFDINRSAIFKLYYFKLYQNGTLVRNFIPCYRKSDNEIGMYDTVSKQFFTNQGTGTFLKGDDVDRIHGSIDWTNDVGTVYGGYVDLVSGELVQTHYKLVADGINRGVVGSIYKDENRDIFGFRIIRNYFSPIGMPGTGSTIICDSLPILYNKYQSQVPFIYSYSNGNRYVILYCGKLSEHPELVETEDYQAFVNAWLVEHPLTFVYKLKTPIHYQLTPQQLTALRGTNTIYSNANGQIDIKYWTRFPKINYMKDVQWLDHSYITPAGKLTEESTALSHTTVNSILLPAGNYRIDGFCYQEPPANSLNCRVHEYSESGSWVKLITSNTASTMSPYILEFSLDHDSYIKLSLPRLLDTKLIKI